MNLFDRLVNSALENQRHLEPRRIAVEKELLHHDILRVLSETGLLNQLTLIGGTCLRSCYGSERLSEDLDFTGGSTFKREQLSDMGKLLQQSIHTKYGLAVSVSEPIREEGKVTTWKLKVETRPQQKHLSAQRINIDVCAIPSYQTRMRILLNPYNVDLGTNGLILRAESREEIFADKLIAFALRPNRIKARDLWDIAWLQQQTIQPALELIGPKLHDHRCERTTFISQFTLRSDALQNDPTVLEDFVLEMRRFLPNATVQAVVESGSYWQFLQDLMHDYRQQLAAALTT
jgi:predicted nucleotidyltransferase component of viral defense system